MGVISVESKVKICPFCSNTEIAFERNPLSKEPKAVPKFVPMGCLGEACMFYNADFKQCAFIIQTVMITNMASKYIGIEKKGE